jgi:hypothetical protein
MHDYIYKVIVRLSHGPAYDDSSVFGKDLCPEMRKLECILFSMT